MSSVLIISREGSGIPIALRLAQEGHVVKIYIREHPAKLSLRGYKNPSVLGSIPTGMLEQFDLILFDKTGLGPWADEIAQKDHFVLGGGAFNDRLEFNSEYQQEVVSELLKTQPERPDNGVEVCTEGWFDGETFTDYFNHSIRYERFMDGGKGSLTDCMGIIAWVVPTGHDEIIHRALEPLTPLLRKVNYLGPLGVTCVAGEEDLYLSGFTAGFSYDTIQATCELFKSSLFDFLWGVVNKENDFQLRTDYAIAVRLSVPPYPGGEQKELEDLRDRQVLEIPDGARSHLLLSDVMLNGNERLAGVSGVVGCVTARGVTIQEVRRRAYRTISNIVLSKDVQYREDIGAGVEGKIGQLKQWGWLDA